MAEAKKVDDKSEDQPEQVVVKQRAILKADSGSEKIKVNVGSSAKNKVLPLSSDNSKEADQKPEPTLSEVSASDTKKVDDPKMPELPSEKLDEKAKDEDKDAAVDMDMPELPVEKSDKPAKDLESKDESEPESETMPKSENNKSDNKPEKVKEDDVKEADDPKSEKEKSADELKDSKEAAEKTVDTPIEDTKTDENTEEKTEKSADDDKQKELSPQDLEAQAAEEAKHDVVIQKLVDSQKYFIPINSVEKRKTKRFVIAGIALSLILAVAWVDIALDAGLVHINGLKSVTHFFSN